MKSVIAWLVRLITGARLCPASASNHERSRIYFANHSSHLDTLVLWAALPSESRERLRPAAAADYWGRTALHRWLATRMLNAILIERQAPSKERDPIGCMVEVLGSGSDVLIFPEGTRQLDGVMGTFKPGLFHLAKRCPNVDLVPVHLENLCRILPKGEIFPLPLIAGARIGPPISCLGESESKPDFLQRAQSAVLSLGPPT